MSAVHQSSIFPFQSACTMRRYLSGPLFWAVAVAVLIFPSLLRGEEEGADYGRARRLVDRVLQELRPSADAVFEFTQTRRRLGHLSRPWQTWQSAPAGTFLLADQASSFYQIDSVQSGPKVYTSYAFCCDTLLAVIDYGQSEPRAMTESGRHSFLYSVSRLTPVFILKDFLARDPERSFVRYAQGITDSVVYLNDRGETITIEIDGERGELKSVSVLYCDDLYGDVTDTFSFENYAASDDGEFRYPTRIVERELGIEASEVSVALGSAAFDREQILAMIPPSYRIREDAPEREASVTHTQYNERIRLIELPHTGSRVLLVEFRDFLLVTGAPLNSANGELIIGKARELAPDKPIRYFVPGHHHPHYIGGIRPFVHKGATVVAAAPDSAYVRQLVTFPHTLEPDSLQLRPRPLNLQTFEGETTITDDELELRIIDIGTMSAHADNFLIFYFPQYKLLFQDELVWIPEDKPLTAASPRQKGLYEAIRLHNLEVETILQSWPLDRGYKSVIDFRELQQSVEEK